ncbi:hypothetical protein M378DRAFT_108284 [Amanita muscaria Koide BX008]|uniref:Alpha-ketoglutarate-dependent dioxygenase AlkB-like domain-containing protein n=1 Tax=Amanita muscaria (strain Koide BX008) TaxID=946122 RepID=A0A0C2T7K5_AMAMK|nr:hypothetical protein M378DRAFT_108284 [Amanita muscaria Koide BX008]
MLLQMHAEAHKLEDVFDTSLQQKDPLASLLVVYAIDNRPKIKGTINNVAKLLSDNDKGMTMVQCWLDIAYPFIVRKEGSARPVADFRTCAIFFEFQWELWSGGKEKAEAYLVKLSKNDSRSSPTFTISQAHRTGQPRKHMGPPIENESRKNKKRNSVTTAQHPNGRPTENDIYCTHNAMETGQQMTNVATIKIEPAAPPVDPMSMENVLCFNPMPSNTCPSAGDAILPDGFMRPSEEGPYHPQALMPNAFPYEDEMRHNWLCETEQKDFYVEEEEAQVAFSILDGYNDSDPGLLNDRPKPPLLAYPPIWAQSRQEVCESFGWFRSYQGGVYFTRDIVKGYLLGGFSASRDRFEHEGRLIISHGGGKAACMLHQSRQNVVTAEDDQLAQDKSVRALLRTYEESRPLVLVIDEKYALFPFDLSSKGVTYAVLGFYTIAHAWAEFQPASNEQGRVVRYKFAFRWCEGQGQPWWIQDPGADMPTEIKRPVPRVPPRRSPVKISERPLADIKPSVPTHLYSTCFHCLERSPNVYIQAWACLNPECPLFWTTRDSQKLPDRLDYNPQFLELTEPLILTAGLVNGLKPSIPLSAPSNRHTTTYACTRGWHCNHCGRLSCRFKWEKYECAHCQSSLNIPGQIRSSNALRGLHVPVPFQDYNYSAISKIAFASVRDIDLGEGRGSSFCSTFELPFGRGFIHHIKSCTPSVQPVVDQVFKAYQEQALTGVLPFRRWPMRAHRCRGPLLTNYFSQNCGAPYQYVGGTANTLPWDKAPHAVVSAKELIELQVSKALAQPVEFNEVLSAAYMERQRMAFHSDSEPGLGPLVAGLSLGSPALMHFRLLAKYEPIQEQRQIAITFVLRHGDILVMDGAGIQEYYEHTVVPSNFRIAATARFIDNGHISTEPVHRR